MVKKWAAKGEKHQPIFIIGAPRTGSTILYQILTNHLDVLYISNLVNLCRENTFLGFRLHKTFFGNKPHNCFTSRFGQTEDGGLIAPHEGLFWYKWLPTDKHYVVPEEISPKDKQEMRDYFYAIMNFYDRPLLVKNLSFSLRLELLHDLFPAAKFINIRRNPLDTSLSLLKARDKNKIDDQKMWSILPPGFQEKSFNNKYELIVYQIHKILQEIENRKSLFPADHWIDVNYENLQDVSEILNEIAGMFDINESYISVNKNNLYFKKSNTCQQKEKDYLTNEIYKYSWT